MFTVCASHGYALIGVLLDYNVNHRRHLHTSTCQQMIRAFIFTAMIIKPWLNYYPKFSKDIVSSATTASPRRAGHRLTLFKLIFIVIPTSARRTPFKRLVSFLSQILVAPTRNQHIPSYFHLKTKTTSSRSRFM